MNFLRWFATVLLLAFMMTQIGARPSRTTTASREEKDKPEEPNDMTTSYRTGTEEEGETSGPRDTFFRLNPEPNPKMEAEPGRRHHRDGDGDEEQEEEESGTALRPLRDGHTVLALTTADVISGTVDHHRRSMLDNCRGELFKHKVRVAGCRPMTVVNRFCHGSCASFYIPRVRARTLKAIFQSCAACVPAETDQIQIRLDCPGRAEGELYRTVMRVKRCACRNIVLDGEAEEEDEEEEGPEGTEKSPRD